MTLREKIANWLTGGKYADAMIDSYRLHNHFAPGFWKREDALDRIAAMETPGANATVKRMAKVAREAVE